MADELSPSARKVQEALSSLGLECKVVELPDSTRTAVDAAKAIGCAVGQIVKSLVFQLRHSGQPLLVLVSGSNRVDEKRLAGLVGEPVVKAEADFVRQHTGLAIGGIPPLGHSEELRTLIDRDLLQYTEIWAAAGTPHAVFSLASSDLERLPGVEVVQVV
jgi:prolyl-tRNA editing enzyme YbaK/EbsC (Cys-tRNA(Pro) deacylase)